MARMRYLKPEFWTDSKIVQMSPWGRLLFQGSWNFAICDSGHLDDDAMALKLKVLPADPIDAQDTLEEVVTSGRILRKTLPDGRTYLQVKNLINHQKVESRWNTRCPYCAAEESAEVATEPLPSVAEIAEPLRNSAEVGRDSEDSAQEGIGGEGRGGEEELRSSSNSAEAESGDSPDTTQDERGRSDVDELCGLLVDLLVANDCRKPYVTKTWRREARLLLDRDGIQLELAQHVMRWALENSFWKPHIQSMKKFREKFDTLRTQRREEHLKKSGGNVRPITNSDPIWGNTLGSAS